MTSGEFGLVLQGVAQTLIALCILFVLWDDSRGGYD